MHFYTYSRGGIFFVLAVAISVERSRRYRGPDGHSIQILVRACPLVLEAMVPLASLLAPFQAPVSRCYVSFADDVSYGNVLASGLGFSVESGVAVHSGGRLVVLDIEVVRMHARLV
jgi:hypothetical protein